MLWLSILFMVFTTTLILKAYKSGQPTEQAMPEGQTPDPHLLAAIHVQRRPPSNQFAAVTMKTLPSKTDYTINKVHQS